MQAGRAQTKKQIKKGSIRFTAKRIERLPKKRRGGADDVIG